MSAPLIFCPKCGTANAPHNFACDKCREILPSVHSSTGGASSMPYAQPTATAQSSPFAAPPPTASAPLYSPPAYVSPQAGVFHCPVCGTTAPPVVTKKISNEGWIVFAAMIIFCFPLFFIGLLMKQDVRVCSVCNAQYS